jgi:hypothetical protein
MGFRGRLAIDVVGLLGYIAASNIPLTGIAIHEWLSVALAVLFAVHAAVNLDWTIRVFKRFLKRLASLSRTNLVIDIALFAMFVAVMLSGLLVSHSIVPILGLSVPMGPTWKVLHSLTAKFLLLIVGLHVGLHWRWFVKAIGRLAAKPATEPLSPAMGDQA